MGGRGSAGRTRGPAPQQTRVRDAYAAILARLNAEPGAWVGLADLREQLPELGKTEFDAVVRSLNSQQDVLIEEETNQKNLTPRDRDASVIIGTRQQHVISIRPELLATEPASGRTQPARPFDRTDAAAAVAGIEAAPTREQAQARLSGLNAAQLTAVGDLIGLSPADSTPANIINRAAPRHTGPPQ
jgi:hypothetical protein